MSEKDLNELFSSIKKVIVNISIVKIKEKDVDIDFLSNPKASEANEVTIEITELIEELSQASKIRQKLAKKFGEVLSKTFPDSKVECFALTPNNEIECRVKWLPES
jgi:hypothetical protein